MATQTTTTTTYTATGVVGSIQNRQNGKLPPFPSDIPTAPLLRIPLSSLRHTSSSPESQRLFDAATSVGFFYLDLSSDWLGEKFMRLAAEMFELMTELFAIGPEELKNYDESKTGSGFGYKGQGSTVAGTGGERDRTEFYKIPKDDILEQSLSPTPHPPLLSSTENRALFASYIRTAHEIEILLLEHLNKHLGLPTDTLANLHRLDEPSGDHVRFIRSPAAAPSISDDSHESSEKSPALGAHTDFGSVTLLFNKLGGLQVLCPPPNHAALSFSPESNYGINDGDFVREEWWKFVKPLEKHCIVNFGDAMTKFSNGKVKSAVHRVVKPPSGQGSWDRYSLVYFGRPGDEVVLRRLEGGNVPGLKHGEREQEVRSKDWIKWKATRNRVEGSR